MSVPVLPLQKPITAKRIGGQGELLGPGHSRADARMMRRLINSPVYVPNTFFREGAKRLWEIVENTDVEDQRVRVAAAKTIVDICRINLETRKHTSGPKPAINLHLHQHKESGENFESLTEEELVRLKELMDKAGLAPVGVDAQRGGTHAASD